MSGANSTPLGRMNPAIGAGKKSAGMSLLNPSYIGNMGSNSSFNNDHTSQKRDTESEADAASERKRKRKSRWQTEEKERIFIPGMPTMLPPNMNKEQEEAYLLQLQIEEISRRLRINDLGIPPNPEDRSPSPEPIYNNEGKRLNTREYRTRKKLEEDRHHLIQKMSKLNPEYKPPTDYKPPLIRICDKVMIPQEEHPEINFVGLLIGPRGNTLKAMEKETGAKIIIRGKGSVKEGKVGRKDGQPLPGEDEPLHAYICSTNPEIVKKAVNKIKDIIKQGVDMPESHNDLRRMQLRELALLNGTLRETDGPKCSNCGATTHKSWQCQDKPNFTNSVVCSNCGGTGHIAKDCRHRIPGGMMGGGGGGMGMGADRQKIDEEYMSLMAELGEGPPLPPSQQNKGSNNDNSNRFGPMNNSRGLFDNNQSGPQRAIMAPPPGSQGPPPMNMGGPNMGNQVSSSWGGPLSHMQGSGFGNDSSMMQNHQTNNNNNSDIRNAGPGSFGGSGYNRPPPPMNWQQNNQGMMGPPARSNQQQSNQSGGGPMPFQPPPRNSSNMLSAPPPPPPPPTGPNSGNLQSWMKSGGGGANNPGPRPQGGMNSWQGGGAPGPVPPPPRPVGPPQGWGWNSSGGAPPPPPPSPGGGGSGQRPSGVDLGALLSAPPPPPPS